MNKLIIRYVVALNRLNNQGETSIGCRITYNKQRKQFSTGVFINPKNWNNKLQEAEPPDKENTLINQQLSLIDNKIRQAFLLLQVKEDVFTVNDIYSLYKGEKIAKEYNVIEYFELYLNKLKKLIGIDIKQVTWSKFYYVKNNVKSFIKHKYKSTDIPLKKLKLQF